MQKTLKLTDAELDIIRYWAERNAIDGWYRGNKEQYFNRLAKIEAKVLKLIQEK